MTASGVAGRLGIAALLLVVMIAACSSQADDPVTAGPEDATAQPDLTATTPPAPTAIPATAVPPTVTPAPTSTPEPPPTATPSPTATPLPTATPTPTPTVDTTPVIIDAGDWTITQGEIDEYMRFVEETHQLEFTAPVGVNVYDDIGLEFAPGFEIFNVDHWYLLRGLGLAEDQDDRDSANQVRRDRIRGVCCPDDGTLAVGIEIQPTKLGTATILVHEFVHALHRQHPELYENTSFETDEAPVPFAAAIEGVPQFVSFEFLRLASDADQAEVIPDLPIIRNDMIPLLGRGPARYLNFAYAAGPDFVEAVVEANGLEGLSQLLNDPPVTTEQVLFPEKYLADEVAAEVPDPTLPEGVASRTRGTIGAAMFMFLLTDNAGVAGARQMVEPWSGDRFVVYEVGQQACMIANIAMDSLQEQVSFGEALADSLRPAFPDVSVEQTADFVAVRTCAVASVSADG